MNAPIDDRAPIGRRAEFDAIVARLDARQPAVVLVAGQPGSGRSRLLADVGDAARRRGYRVLDTPMVVEETTKVSDVRRVLASLVAQQPAEGDGVAPRVGLSEVRGALRSARQAATAVLERFKDDLAVFDLLRTAAPTMLAVDGYMPSVAFGLWVTSRLLPGVKRSDRPVVVVVADRIEPLDDLRGTADEVFELGELSRDEVRAYLSDVGRTLEPPLTTDELDAYCDATVSTPELFDALDRVLRVLGGSE